MSGMQFSFCVYYIYRIPTRQSVYIGAMTEQTLILHNVKNRKGQAKSDKSNPRQNTYGQNKRGYKTNF